MMSQKEMGKSSFQSELPIWKMEQYKDWIRPLSGESLNSTKVYCILCNQSLAPRRATLDGHAGTKKHRERLSRNGLQTLPKSPQYQEVPPQQSTTLSIQGVLQCQGMLLQQSATSLNIPGLLLCEKPPSSPSVTSSRLVEKSREPSSESPKRPRLSTEETTAVQTSSANIPQSLKRPRLSIAETTKTQVNSPNIAKSVMLKSFEPKFLLCNVIHSNTLHGDHFMKILSGLPDSQRHLSSFAEAHGRQCIEMMKIIAKDIRKKLRFDIGKQPYSILINEYQWSYKPNEHQYFCLCIKYFSERKQSIATNFLGFIEISRPINHHELGELVIKHLRDFELDLQNLIGLGAEAANLKLTAEYSSLYGSLRRKKPNLLLIPFLPQSLDMCFSSAVKKLPSPRDFRYLWISIHNLFAQDPTLSFRYPKVFYNVQKNFKNGFSLSEESWLLGLDVINAIIKEWSWLKKYFNDLEKNRRTSFWKKIFNNDEIHLYFIIISRILWPVNRLYSELTKEDVSIECFYPYLYKLLLELMQIIILPERIENLDDMTNNNFEKIKGILEAQNPPLKPHYRLNYGSTFSMYVREYNTSRMNGMITEIKEGGRNFILELCRQIIRRFPTDFEVYEALQMFSRGNALHEREKKNFQALPQEWMNNNGPTVESEWQNLRRIPRDEVPLGSSEAFWIRIRKYKNRNGENKFRELADLALKALSLPFGNNNIEYIFSLTKSLQTHIREQIQIDVLNATIQIRSHFFAEKLDCKSFELTQTIIEKLQTVTCDGSCDPGDIIFELIRSTAS